MSCDTNKRKVDLGSRLDLTHCPCTLPRSLSSSHGEGDEGREGDEGDEEVSCWGKMTDACASSGVWLSPHSRGAWVAESIEVFRRGTDSCLQTQQCMPTA